MAEYNKRRLLTLVVFILVLIIYGIIVLVDINTTPSDGRIPVTEERENFNNRFTVRDNTEEMWGDNED